MPKTNNAIAIPEPPVEISGSIAKLKAWAGTLVVRTPAQYTAAISAIQDVKSMRQRVVDFFKPSKELAYAAHKAISANEKSFTDKLDLIERAAKQALGAYERIEEENREKERRKAQAEADERARKEREALETKAAKLKSPEKKEALLEQAAAVTATVVEVASKVPDVSGVSTRKIWKAEIVNLELFLANACNEKRTDLLLPNTKTLDALAKALKERASIPGVRFYEDRQMAIAKDS